MNKRLEEMLQLHIMCSRELSELKQNINWYLQKTNKQADLMKKTWHELSQGGSLTVMSSYDNFVNSITKVMNLSRTLNLFLQYSHSHYQKYNEDNDADEPDEDEENSINKTSASNAPYTKDSIEDSIKNLSIEFDDSGNTLPNMQITPEFHIIKQDLKIYQKHKQILCSITYIEDLEALQFYIIDRSSPYQKDIYHLANSLGLKQYQCVPPENEVFGLLLENKIWRAMRSHEILVDSKSGKKYWPCYLLDTGEIVHLLADNITYILEDAHKLLPSLAILCKLYENNSSPTQRDLLKQELLKKEFQTCQLEIIEVQRNSLKVNFLATETNSEKLQQEDKCNSKKPTLRCETNPFRNSQNSNEMFSKEDIEMFYEEPTICTSNAMKAVMGHDPKDEQRLCRFYNPATDSCFKGANCKQEHTPRQPEGWTKDNIPVTTIASSNMVNNNVTQVIYKPGSVINITPTSIDRFDRFYGQINDPYKVNTPLIWNDEDIPSWQVLQKPPLVHDIVLARYEDGLWYRARVIEHDDSYKMFKIFYVDYGNSQHIHLRNLARCDRGQTQYPYQALLFRLPKVQEVTGLSLEERKSGLLVLSKALLNNTIDVRVVEHYEDLYVDFLGDNKLLIIELKELGCLQSKV